MTYCNTIVRQVFWDPADYTSVSWSAGSAGTGFFHATSVKLASFDFLFFGRITLIATASSEVLMWDA